MAPRILSFSIAMGADYSFYVKTIDTHARAFLVGFQNTWCNVIEEVHCIVPIGQFELSYELGLAKK